MASDSPKVFISYSHDSTEHTRRVHALADRLRADGVEAWIDQYTQDPNEGWIRWMRQKVKQADRVLLVFTKTYQRRFEGDEEEGKGLGATFEGVIVTQELYEDGGSNAKFRSVVFSQEDEQFIPLELRRLNRYRVDTQDHYQDLLRWLYQAPSIVAPTIGQKPDFPTKPAPKLFERKPHEISRTPLVFLSYRHENDAHRTRVRVLGERLRAAGIEIVLDQFFLDANPGGPEEGWPTWSKNQVARSEKVLIVGSPGWYRCYDGTEVPGSGLGAAAEGRVIAQRIYNESGLNRIARFVFFDSVDKSGVPLDLQGYHHFDAAADLDNIVKWITGTLAFTPQPALRTGWPAAPPVLDWQSADCEPVREAFTRLLSADTPHRVLLIRGPSGSGKTHLTRQILGLAVRFRWLACGRFDLKSGADLDDEFARFVFYLDLDETVLAAAKQGLSVRLDAVLMALRARGQPALLLFDTFEQGGEWARWVEEHALLAVLRAPCLRLLVAGQQVPSPTGTAWASCAAPVIQLQPLGWEPWYQFGKRYRPDLTPEFIRQVHSLTNGNHSLLEQLLSPQV